MKKVFFFLVMFVVFSASLFAQKNIHINYTDEKVKTLAEEVYKNETQYLTPGHLSMYKTFLNRIEIVEASDDQLKYGGFPLISTLILKNKYNPDLDYDKGPNFDINSFNPLKYFFVIGKDGASNYYRIYNTKYLVKLLPNN